MENLVINNSSFKAPAWLKLDNAATIYPSTLTRKYAVMFRMTVTLTEKVDYKVLTKALNNVMKRFPTFSYRLRQGFFWCYFSRIDHEPVVVEDVANPLLRIDWKENRYFMFRIRYYENRIAIEIFHALTDGTGGITFLLTLAGEYLRLKNKIAIEYSDIILDPKASPHEKEYEDSFIKYARGIGNLEHETVAFHPKGHNEEMHLLNIITGTIPIKDLKKVAKNYNCTITEFLASIMIQSIQTIKEKTNPKSKKDIKISIPVNLRKIYNSKTLRNFSSYVNVGISSKYGHYSLEEIIKQVKGQIGIMATEKRLNAKISGNVNLMKNYFIRCIPMFIKKYMLLIGERLMGDRYCSSTLSNIGLITVPDIMSKYISKMNFIIGKSSSKPGSCACIGYKGNLSISFSRKIKEAETERIFFHTLVDMGIPVEIESNQRR